MSAPNMNHPAIGFGPLAESELDASIEPWHHPGQIRQREFERRQHDAAAVPTEAAHPVTEFCDDNSQTVGDAILDWLTPRRFWALYVSTLVGAMLGVWGVLS